MVPRLANFDNQAIMKTDQLFPIERLAAKPLAQKQVFKPKRYSVDYEQRTLEFDVLVKRDLSLSFQETYCGFGIYRKGDSWIAGNDPKAHASRSKARRSALRQARGVKLGIELELQA